METKQKVESILETVREELTQFVESESEITCPVEYEERLLRIAMEFARATMLKSSGKILKSRNSKKNLDQFG